MKNLEIVEIRNVAYYGSGCKQFGVVEQRMHDTIIVNFAGYGCGGLCINIDIKNCIPRNLNDFIFSNGKIYLQSFSGIKDIDLIYYF